MSRSQTLKGLASQQVAKLLSLTTGHLWGFKQQSNMVISEKQEKGVGKGRATENYD